MSLAALAGMWRIMSRAGIWFPVRGVHSIPGKLEALCLRHGAELRTGAGVSQILVDKGRAAGVRTESGEVVRSEWVVSNADYKKTFLEFLPADAVPPLHLESVRAVPYTGSELCVYLGLNAARVDFSRLRAEHVIFRKSAARRFSENPEDFAARDVEICLWSRSLPEAAPEGKAAVVLRVSFPYEHFAAWRTGDRKRADGYRAFKTGLARNLIRVAEIALPGLEEAVEVMEIATPLTYRDWGGRHLGSVAGWSWGAGATRGLGGRILTRTPIDRLLSCGITSAAELFWGGLPTALWSGVRAAESLLERS
jgi:all-trans-retinol 13,14-reductase